MKYWEIIADNLSKAGWSWGCVSAIDSKGRTIWIVDAHRGDGKRFVARGDEKLTAFLELEVGIRGSPRSPPYYISHSWLEGRLSKTLWLRLGHIIQLRNQQFQVPKSHRPVLQH